MEFCKALAPVVDVLALARPVGSRVVMRSKTFEGMTCSVASVLEALGDRWGVLIMRDLVIGLRRFDDLRRSTGVTTATLSDRLKKLEAAGLVDRKPYQVRPERYEYVPTRRGRDIRLVLQALVQVGDAWNLAGLDGPPMCFIDARTGHRVRLTLTDVETGEQVDQEAVVARAGPGADDLTVWRVDWAQSRGGSEAGNDGWDGVVPDSPVRRGRESGQR